MTNVRQSDTNQFTVFEFSIWLCTSCIQINRNSCRRQWLLRPLKSEKLFYVSRTIPNYTFTLCERIQRDAYEFRFFYLLRVASTSSLLIYGIMNKHRESIRHVQVDNCECVIARSFCFSQNAQTRCVNWPCLTTHSSRSFFGIFEYYSVYCFFPFLIHIFVFSQISCFLLTIVFRANYVVADGWATKSTCLWLATIWLVLDDWQHTGATSTADCIQFNCQNQWTNRQTQ